jgi:hypothetical protein
MIRMIEAAPSVMWFTDKESNSMIDISTMWSYSNSWVRELARRKREENERKKEKRNHGKS